MNEQHVSELCATLAELLKKKNDDYGDSYQKLREKYGGVAFLIRISDKLSRLESLAFSGSEPKVHDEKVRDTIQDIAGYCILELDYLDSHKQDYEELG
jgi:ElaB/YqjD/DUF883 family membrane-anchored ribosome-binding protein